MVFHEAGMFSRTWCLHFEQIFVMEMLICQEEMEQIRQHLDCKNLSRAILLNNQHKRSQKFPAVQQNRNHF